MSTSDHPDELADPVGGTWHIETAAPETGTAHTIRVGVLSRLPLATFDQVAAFPDKLRAIQQGDKPTENTTAMGRPALHVRVRIQDTDIDLITAHFKSKLLTFPPNRFSPHDEGERARFGAYALYRYTRHRKLRSYTDVANDFNGLDPGALWEDAKLGFAHMFDWTASPWSPTWSG